MTLNLSRFNMRKIAFNANEAKGPVIVMLGKRGTGKSFLIKDLLFHHQDIPVGTVISGSEDGNHFFRSLVPRLFIHNEYNTVIIENILKRQKDAIKRRDKEMQTLKRSTMDCRTFVIMDDCLYDSVWTRDKLMRYLFMNGRHAKVMLVITMQYPVGIPPALRTNIDYVFILRENIITNRKRIYEHYAGMIPSFDAFCQIMDNCTENFECLVIDNTVQSNKLLDQLFWYKADMHNDFRLCNKSFWELSKDIGDEPEEEVFDANAAAAKKRGAGQRITVKKNTNW